MQQTSLNVMAIAIFMVTLSVLLGGIFPISPLIPTLATVAMMGFLTVDTLAWQNQGINIFLGFLASKEEKERIIHHEAGHFLTAYLLDIPVIGYTLTPWEALKEKQLGRGEGGVIIAEDFLLSKKQNLREFNLFGDRLCIVLMAGIAAENLIYNNNNGGENDRQKLSQVLSSFGLNQNYSYQKEKSFILQATTLIKENKSRYESLITAMKSRKSVTECYQVLADLSVDNDIPNA